MAAQSQEKPLIAAIKANLTDTYTQAHVAVLFDVDGTLVNVGGAGRQALILATTAVTGAPEAAVRKAIEAMDFRGATDARLLTDIAAAVGHVFDRPTLLARYLSDLQACIQTRVIEILPGVAALIKMLEARGSIVGLLTGNVREGARCKLRPFGLDPLADRPGGFGDDGTTRVDIARTAVARLTAAGVRPGAVVVVGDTQHDVHAGRAVGAATVAVATGWTAMEDLQQAAPDVQVADLLDPTPLLALLDRMEERGSQ